VERSTPRPDRRRVFKRLSELEDAHLARKVGQHSLGGGRWVRMVMSPRSPAMRRMDSHRLPRKPRRAPPMWTKRTHRMSRRGLCRLQSPASRLKRCGRSPYAMRTKRASDAAMTYAPCYQTLLLPVLLQTSPTRTMFARRRRKNTKQKSNGSGLRPIPLPGAVRDCALAFSPDWSPDGTRLVFSMSTTPSGRVDLYTARPDGSDLVQVADTPFVDERGAAWVPPG